MKQSIPFIKPGGFGDGYSANEHYFARNIQRSQFGLSTGLALRNIYNRTIGALSSFRYMVQFGGYVVAQSNDGKLYATEGGGGLTFANVYTPVSPQELVGNGLLVDAKGQILAFSLTTIRKSTNTTIWVEDWKTGLYPWTHPADVYEGNTFFGNGPQVGMIDSADVMNPAAFPLPADARARDLKSGSNGILIGANIGAKGALILWDGGSQRSIAPWQWTDEILSIAKASGGWIVTTTRKILFTTGYSVRELRPVIDDQYSLSEFNADSFLSSLVINDKLFLMNNGTGFGRHRAGLVIFNIDRKDMSYVPVATRSEYPITGQAIIQFQDHILTSYDDDKSYIAELDIDAGQNATFISELLAESATTKAAEAVVLNISPAASRYSRQTLSFSASVKVYNFERPLWGWNVTNATAGAANQIRVDGTSSTATKARVGDEVTILKGPNAGQVRHITAIANEGASNETWTLDSALPNATGSNIYLDLQPFQFVETKTFTNLSQMQELYFDVKNKTRGKKFLVKIIFEGITNAQLELHPSVFVYDDLKLSS